jgi:hypothetical protein
MCAAYCGELNGTGLLPDDPQERDALFAACELHQTLYRLAHLRPWKVPLARAAQWVDEARELFARACGAEARPDASAARSANA